MSQSLQKGIEALMFLSSRKSVGVTELAEKLGTHKSTAFRILDTFLAANLAEKNPATLKYTLGPTVLRLSEQYYKNYGLITTARPVIEQLVTELRESVHLCVCSNNSAVVIEQVLSNSRLIVNAKVGNREPLHCSSVGKCLLAFVPEKNREEMLDSISYDSFTEKTIASRNALLEEIEKIKRQGYALDDGELNADIKCVAVPVFDKRGACVYSLGASGAASRMTREKMDRMVPLMIKAAREII